MGKIEYPINPITAYEEWVAMENDTNQEIRKKNDGYMSASSAGMCHKKHFYSMQKVETRPFEKKSLLIMRLGTVMGQDFVKYFDYLSEDSPVTCFREVYLNSKELGVGGHMDLLLVDENNKGWLWDWKTANSFKFKTVFQGGYGSPSTNYELQVSTYGLLALENKLCEEIAHLGLLYYNKDNSTIKEKIVDLNYMDKAEKYWRDVKASTNSFLTEPMF